ncbi:MAG: CCA tRNA nucleotidyltransferase [Maritimibacter sp.]
MSAGRITPDWLDRPGPQALCAMLETEGFEAFFVGGCVRNALLNVPVSDVDIATNAHPNAVVKLAKKSGFNPIPTGIEHGTVTVVVQGEPFEITTYRKDVETDGRRAVVSFAQSMEEDAHRRDFTMNALYADSTGAVFDPIGGLDDLTARRVRFIDEAEERIREDYLRILRFFRFHAWYGAPSGGLDDEALNAISRNLAGIETLSKERIGTEMLKLLSAPDPAPACSAMDATGALARVLPGAFAKGLAVLVHLEADVEAAPDPLRRLAVLGGQAPQDLLRLSKADARRLGEISAHLGSMDSPRTLGYRFGRANAMNVVLANCALLETHLPQNLREEIAAGAEQVLPIRAADLMPAFEGAALGAKLKELEMLWIESGFSLDRDTLLESL